METVLISGTSALSPVPVSVLPLMQRWTAWLDAKDRTAQTYTANIRRFAEYLTKHDESRPTRETVIAWVKSLDAEGKSAATIHGYLTAVKLFFRWAEQEGLYPNVADRVKGKKQDADHKKDYLTVEQAKNLIASVDRSTLKGKRDYAILLLMITTGLRTVSVVSADVGDVERRATGAVLYYLCKGHDEKAVYVKLAPPVLSALDDYLSARGEIKKSDPLFASDANRNAGSRMTTRSVSRIAKESMVGVGLDSARLTAHSLRHTAATLNLLGGGTTEETRQLLNHRSIDTTMIYVHALEREKNQSENRIAAALFG